MTKPINESNERFMSDKQFPSEANLLKIADKIGHFIEYWGFKAVHGRIWTLIFLSPEPVDAGYLISNLKISKTLVSMTLKDLLSYQVIIEIKKERPGTQKYKINPDIMGVIFDVIRKRELRMLEDIKSCFKNVGNFNPDENICAQRLRQLESMVNCAHLLLESVVRGEEVDFKNFEKTTCLKE